MGSIIDHIPGIFQRQCGITDSLELNIADITAHRDIHNGEDVKIYYERGQVELLFSLDNI